MREFLPLSCRADAAWILLEVCSKPPIAFDDDGDLTLHWPEQSVFCTILDQPVWSHRFRIHAVRKNSEGRWDNPGLFKATEFEEAKMALLHALECGNE